MNQVDKTPRTDAAECLFEQDFNEFRYVDPDFARQLETELSILTERIAGLEAKAQVCHDLHDALGVRWGDDPYARIKALLAAELALSRANAALETGRIFMEVVQEKAPRDYSSYNHEVMKRRALSTQQEKP